MNIISLLYMGRKRAEEFETGRKQEEKEKDEEKEEKKGKQKERYRAPWNFTNERSQLT